MEPAIAAVTLVAVVIYLFWFNEPLAGESEAQWHQYIDGLHEDPHDFYTRVLQEVQRHNLPNAEVLLTALLQGRFGFGRRDYLRVTRQRVNFYLFCTPFGDGTFISWWLFSWLTRWLRYPVLSYFVRRYLRWQTLFQHDDLQMFLDVVHGAMLNTLDSDMQAQGLKPLEIEQRRPIMQGFYGRA